MLGVLTGVTPVAVLLGTLSRVTLARADDLQTLYDRRVTSIISGASTSKSKVDNLLNTLQPNGTWASVNYASGCDSQRASWPAGVHWSNIVSMAAAYKGKVAQYKDDPHLLSSIQLAMGFWFSNEMSTVGDGTCMDREYLEPNNCPCGTPGLWGANWFSNVIQVPDPVGQTCNMLRSELTESELGNCTLITSRAFSTFYRETPPSYLTGANVIDISAIGICAGLLDNNKAGNSSKIMDAYQNIHNQVVVEPAPRVDGIKPDGSFQQHKGIIFDGNYGKDFTNSVVDFELIALGTQFQANKTVQDTFGFHLDGSRWMTFTNTLSKVVHWDFSVIGRFISYPVADTTRASSSLQTNLGDVTELGNAWGQQDLIEFGTVLSQAANESSVNSAKLTGSRVFWSSDYVVHRTDQTVTTVKMLSSRTSTSRCTNSEGPYTFHLSDGAVYTYTTGAEYEDMFAALDYDIIPGTTTDYKGTVLDCKSAEAKGVDAYAGGVETKDVGMAAMRYVNPTSKAFRFYKAWFFFPDNVQHVLVSNVEQTNPNSTSPVYSVLDQRLRSGDVYVNGSPISGSAEKVDAKSIWHAGTGYAFPTSSARTPKVSVRLETRTGDWTKLGASKVVATPKDMFAAWIPHQTLTLNPSPNATNSGPGKYTPAEYSVFPATASYEDFKDKATRLGPRTIVNTGTVSAAIDSSARILGAAFWKAGGGYFTVNDMGIKIEVDQSVVLMLKFTDDGRTKGTVSVADPTQGSGKVNIKITSVGSSKKRGHYQRLLGHHGQHIPRVKRTTETSSAGCSLTLDLPAGALAGSTVTGEFSYSG
ncbi:polysaccharide lyase family 8 protein [Rhizoctonia solani]|uniref:Polysaccharide lyase family 8 protein n=1 Tax=Rhizoctonia solani TaxID=456999 RepID=A0A8H8P3I0_9AGAM|nr:polysaccharide lyase family 8 protein [Rhizoctonia solani]QRW23662.1 polysaccharide lyase family 8 protein [Rhizoctonia solani]